jgi:hypothetical protein
VTGDPPDRKRRVPPIEDRHAQSERWYQRDREAARERPEWAWARENVGRPAAARRAGWLLTARELALQHFIEPDRREALEQLIERQFKEERAGLVVAVEELVLEFYAVPAYWTGWLGGGALPLSTLARRLAEYEALFDFQRDEQQERFLKTLRRCPRDLAHEEAWEGVAWLAEHPDTRRELPASALACLAAPAFPPVPAAQSEEGVADGEDAPSVDAAPGDGVDDARHGTPKPAVKPSEGAPMPPPSSRSATPKPAARQKTGPKQHDDEIRDWAPKLPKQRGDFPSADQYYKYLEGEIKSKAGIKRGLGRSVMRRVLPDP